MTNGGAISNQDFLQYYHERVYRKFWNFFYLVSTTGPYFPENWWLSVSFKSQFNYKNLILLISIEIVVFFVNLD